MRLFISGIIACGLAVAAHAQQPVSQPKKETKTKLTNLPLEELLAEVLKHNPDIRAAEAKLREAEAELNRARLSAMQKLTKAFHDLAARRAMVAEANARYKRMEALHKSRAISAEEFDLGRITLSKAEAELAELEAQLPYLVGKAQPSSFVAEFSLELPTFWKNPVSSYTALSMRKEQPHGALSDKLRKVLDTPFTGEWRDTPVHEIITYFGKKFQDAEINFFNNATVASKQPGKASIVTMEVKHAMPLGAALQFVEDLTRLRFVLREYGVVLTPPEFAPPGAIFVVDFWKNRPHQNTPAAERGK